MEPRPDLLKDLTSLVSILVPNSYPAMAIVVTIVIALYYGAVTYLGVHDVFQSSNTQETEVQTQTEIKAARIRFDGERWRPIEVEVQSTTGPGLPKQVGIGENIPKGTPH